MGGRRREGQKDLRQETGERYFFIEVVTELLVDKVGTEVPSNVIRWLRIKIELMN